MNDFFIALVLIVVVGRIGSEMAERVGQPAVLGEIPGGLSIGIGGLRWIDPADPLLRAMAEIGVLLLLFEVGLECDAGALIRSGGAALWVAITGVVLPMAGGYVAGLALGWRGSRPFARAALVVWFTAFLVGMGSVCRADEPKPDPAGVATGDKSNVSDAGGTGFQVTAPTDKSAPDYAAKSKAYEDYRAQVAREPLAAKLADSVGHVRIGLNFAWTLLTGYLVLFMQAGFALLTTGLVRKKNAGHLMMLNFAAYVFAFLAYYLVGYAFMFGAVAINAAPSNLGGTPTLNHFLIGNGSWGFLGGRGFLLSGPGYDAGANALMLFEVVFMETAGYIIVGAISERITFGAFLLSELFVGSILYPVVGCWVWGGGWLSQLGATWGWGHGYVDFAGSTVVHGIGGFCAMALAVLLGPRIGKYRPDGKPNAFPAHNIPFVVTGTFILLFGWMGFNPGSTLDATDLRIAVVAVNTNLAACAGSAAALAFWYWKFGKPDITMACNGMLAGLVAITAPCAFVGPNSAVLIGLIAGVVVCCGVLFNDRIKIDDPCGAISVHGYCGILGGLCLGIFADGRYGAGWNGVGADKYMGVAGQGVTGLLHGDVKQFLYQVFGAIVMAIWAFGSTYIVFKTVNAIKPIRVTPEVELEGLDIPEFGTLAYAEDLVGAKGM